MKNIQKNVGRRQSAVLKLVVGHIAKSKKMHILEKKHSQLKFFLLFLSLKGCYKFQYGNCKPTKNSFDTKKKCEAKCLKKSK